MSEFRIFCIGAFAGIGLTATAQNHGVNFAHGDLYTRFLMVGFVFGCLGVAFFGRRFSK